MSMHRSIWTGVSSTDLMGGLAALGDTWWAQGYSLVFVLEAEEQIRLLSVWLPNRPQHLLAVDAVIYLPSWSLAVALGSLPYARRVSRLVLCLVLCVGQKPFPEGPFLRGHSREWYLLPLKEGRKEFLWILSRLSWGKLWKHLSRRKHKFVISKEKGNY